MYSHKSNNLFHESIIMLHKVRSGVYHKTSR